MFHTYKQNDDSRAWIYFIQCMGDAHNWVQYKNAENVLQLMQAYI